jgi:competence protein ComEC
MKADLRLAVPVMFAWAAVAVLIAFPSALWPAAFATWGAAILLAAVAFLRNSSRSRRRSSSNSGSRAVSRWKPVAVVAVVCLAATALLVTVAAVRAPERQPAFLLHAASGGRFVAATVTTNERLAASDSEEGASASPWSATLTAVTFGHSTTAVSIPITVFGGEPSVGAQIGEVLSVSGSLAASDPADAESFLLFAAKPSAVVAEAPWYLAWANTLRAGFSTSAARLPGTGGDLLPGLAIGDTAAVTPTLDAEMKATSLSHLTAVSGANCAVVIGLIMLAGAALGLSRAWRIGFSLAVLVGFVILVTPQASVLRASAMAILVLLATARGRPVRGVPILALASLILLVADPWMSRSYGFLLSVLATGGLLTLAGPLSRALSRVFPAALAAVISIPLAAQLACQPVLILLNPAISTWGILANMLAEPAAPIATVLGLIACVVLPLSGPVGHFIAQLAWLPSAWIAGVAHFFAVLPAGSIPWLPGAVGVFSLAALTVLVLVMVIGVGRRRRVAAIGLVLALVCTVGVFSGNAVRTQLSRPSDWQIAACDIGQGDAVLVRSLGQVALIDTGPDPALLSKCLSELGIQRIDLLILSHYDLDHVGGTSAVLGRVTHAMVGPPDTAQGKKIGADLAKSGATVEQVSRGLHGQLGELNWQVLWPRNPLAGTAPGNDASLTVHFTPNAGCASGCLSSLFLGDLGNEPQLLMAASNHIVHVDVVKVAHHGSADQHEELYQQLSATVGLISVGLGNDYGHPTDKLLGMLKRAGTLATRTDREGMILLSPRPDKTIALWTEKAMPAAKLSTH